MGTATDVNAMLRILFSRLGDPHIGSAQAYSFNVPSVTGSGAVTVDRGDKSVREHKTYTVTGGMCRRCEGLGEVSDIAIDQIVDRSLSLAQGAITVPGYTADGWMVKPYIASGKLDPNKPVGEYSERELSHLLYAQPQKVEVDSINVTYEG